MQQAANIKFHPLYAAHSTFIVQAAAINYYYFDFCFVAVLFRRQCWIANEWEIHQWVASNLNKSKFADWLQTSLYAQCNKLRKRDENIEISCESVLGMGRGEREEIGRNKIKIAFFCDDEFGMTREIFIIFQILFV